MQNIEKMTRKKEVGTKFHDTEGRGYISKARMDKRNKPQRGGGVKGVFRDNTTGVDNSTLIYGE